jgi:RimJ/RimL family protein N-acetyltransferase
MKIREATAEDAKILFDLGEALKEDDLFIVGEGLPKTVEEEQAFLEYVTPEKNLVLLAVKGKVCVGNTITNIGPFRMNRHTADIGIGVLKGHRGKGIGTRLMKETMKLLKKRGVNKATISVFAPNKEARRFYEKLGFTQEGVKEGQWLFKGEYIDEIIMAKWL